MSADVFLAAAPLKRRQLSNAHRSILEQDSAILSEIIKGRGYYTLSSASIKILVGENVISKMALAGESWLAMPILRPDGVYHGDVIRVYGGNCPVKYIWPTGLRLAVDIHPMCLDDLDDPAIPIMYTEGIKKGDAILSRSIIEGIPLIPASLSGNWGWKTKGTAGSSVVPDILEIPVTKRVVYVNSDSDFRTKDEVRKGWTEAAYYFAGKTEDKTKSLLVVTPANGVAKQGADDFFQHGGTLAELLATAATPVMTHLETIDSQNSPILLPYRTGFEVVSTAATAIPYLMEPIIPEDSIMLVAGHSGTYKTWHILSQMLDAAFGYEWTDHPGIKKPITPYTTIYINKEMSRAMLDQRLKLLAVNKRYADRPDFQEILEKHIVVVEEKEMDLASQPQRDRLENLIQLTGAKHVVLDSFSMCWTGDENSASEVAAFFMLIRGITERKHVAWTLIHHLVKPPQGSKRGKDPDRFNVRGSGQLIQQTDTALLLMTPDTDDPPSGDGRVVQITHAKTRTTKEMVSWLTKFQDHDGMFYDITYVGAVNELRAKAYSKSGGDPLKFASWMKGALTYCAPIYPSGPGMRTKQLIALLQASWEVPGESAPSASTMQRHLNYMADNNLIECVERNGKLGDRWRLKEMPVHVELDEEAK